MTAGGRQITLFLLTKQISFYRGQAALGSDMFDTSYIGTVPSLSLDHWLLVTALVCSPLLEARIDISGE